MIFNVVLNKYQLLFRHNRELAPDFYNFVIAPTVARDDF